MVGGTVAPASAWSSDDRSDLPLRARVVRPDLQGRAGAPADGDLRRARVVAGMSVYFDALRASMLMLADDPRVVFMGQAVACDGTAMSRTFKGIPAEKLIELPVFEDCQMGVATGASLAGLIPVTCYPRQNFLLLAMSQLVLHLDALPRYSTWRPKVIVRTAIATPHPLDPGPQHLGDHTDAIAAMLTTVEVVRLDSADRIVPEYGKALQREGSTLLVERLEMY